MSAALGSEESWSRQALAERTGASDDELVSEALEFIHSCASSTPLAGYAHLFDRAEGKANESLRESLLDGLATFRSDLARFQQEPESPSELIDGIRLAPTLQAAFFYRVSHALFLRRTELIPDVLASLSRLLTGVEIYYSADIGPGLKLIHGLGTVIGAMCRVGSNCTVYQNVTIGDKLGRETGTDKRPTIGDYVVLSVGAKVLGPVTIGPKTVVGANAVVLSSLPGNCVAAGLPAKKVSDLSDERFQEFWRSFRG